jgi:cytochrome c biogenesis protein CcmG/thiol:disulfide interchange protein DsbE
MSARTFGVFIAVLALVGLLGYGLISKGEAAISVGDPAPDKELAKLDGSGTGRLADYRGKWVLVNFWASWCEPCRAEAPVLERFHRQHLADDFTVLGIDLDDATDDARAFVAEFGLTYPQLRDGDGRDRREAYGMTGFPESFLVDPEGRLALIRRGPVDEEILREQALPLIEGRESVPGS